MSTYNGKDAIVQVGDPASTVGKVRSVSYNGTVEVQEDEYLGEAGFDTAVGNQRWEGSITIHHDPDDAGQAKLKLGETVTFTVFPRGQGTGKPQEVFEAIITGNPNTLEPASKVEKQIPFRIQGIPTESVQS